jgi:sialidase-1
MLIEKVNNGTYSQCRIPGIVLTQTGTLLAYYECRKSNSDWADIDIKVIRSTDLGDTWQTVTVITGNGNTLNNPVMFVKGAELHFLFLKNYKELFHCVSMDDGKTFSAPRQISIACDFFYNAVAVGPGHGIVHDGKMIVPVWFAQCKEYALAHRPSIISTLYSADGETWHLGEFIGNEGLVNPSECALAVTAENKVLISIRNESDRHQRALALSDNGFSGWKDLRFSAQLPDPVCMGSMYHENGRIYHINCDSGTARENLTVKISEDCFESFESIFVDTPAGYADIAVKDNTLFVFYERDCNNGGLYFKKIFM